MSLWKTQIKKIIVIYQKHRDPLDLILREEYHAVLTQYKTLLHSKKNE